MKPNLGLKGGARKGAGRPFNTGKYKEQTIVIRVPKSLYEKIDEMLEDFRKNVSNNQVLQGENDEEYRS